MKKFSTHVNCPPETRQMICERLNVTMASTIDLYSQVKQAHWNLKGPHFVSRHLLFDDLATRLRGWSDEMAERISTLGGYANGTARQVAAGSVLEEYNLDAINGNEHIRALVNGYAAFTKHIRQELGDSPMTDEPVTEDLLIETLRGAEKDMWFLETHINV